MSGNGTRFSHNYLRSLELLPDSPRMRMRLAGPIFSLGDSADRAARLQRELGVKIGYLTDEGDWVRVLERIDLRDVLDTITIIHNTIREKHEDDQARRRGVFIAICRRILSEEQVRYRIDDDGSVHFTVDELFEVNRIATIRALSGARYTSVRELFEKAFKELDHAPPNGKSAIRHVFFATEGLFRLMFEKAAKLDGAEVQKHLEPAVNRLHTEDVIANRFAQKMVASLRDWIDAAHFYRHEPGTEEPAQPPLELAIYCINQAAGHIRWLAQLDAQLQKD